MQPFNKAMRLVAPSPDGFWRNAQFVSCNVKHGAGEFASLISAKIFNSVVQYTGTLHYREQCVCSLILRLQPYPSEMLNVYIHLASIPNIEVVRPSEHLATPNATFG
jgi:hypothetical protein